MKQEKYSESKIKIAQLFLSKYDLSFDSLNKLQKKVVVNYTSVQKLFGLSLAALIFALTVFSAMAYLSYSQSESRIEKVVELSLSGESINLDKFGHSSFSLGFTIGAQSCTAFAMLLYIIMLLLTSKLRGQVFDVFLPALKQSSDDDENSSN